MKKIIHILLFISFFSAILRPSQESPVTLFRVLIPLCLWVIFVINRKYFKNLIRVALLFLAVSVIQDFFTRTFFYPSLDAFSHSVFMQFCLHYFTIFVVVALVYSLWYIDKTNFYEDSIRFASKTVRFCIFLYLVYYILGGDPMKFLYIGGNVNNFGCMLAAGMLAVIFDKSTRIKTKFVYSLLIPLILLNNDSKLALMGAVLEIILYVVFYISVNATKKMRKNILIGLSAISFFIIYKYFTSSSNINGYELQTLIVLPFEYITSGTYLDESLGSITFRINSVVGISNILMTTFGFGVGPGNTNALLTILMPNTGGELESDLVSSHIWWYEVMSDLGWIIIIPSLKVFFRQLRHYVLLKGTNMSLFSQILVISFPIWCTSASGLYTEYYCIMMITIAIILFKYSKNNNACYRQKDGGIIRCCS